MSQLTPIHCAHSKEIIELLIAAGANVNEKERLGRTPLHNVVRRDSLENVKVFVHAGADLNERDSYGRTAIDEALRMNRKKIFHFLMKAQNAGNLEIYWKWYVNLERILHVWDMINPFYPRA